MLLQSYKQRMIQVTQSIQGSHIISQIRQIIPDRMIHELNLPTWYQREIRE